MKLLKRIGIILVLLLAVVSAGTYMGLRSKKPQYEGKIKLKGLDQKVEVYVDDYGIPHIYAQSETDAQFALGYMHAQDRLFQMEMIRRVAWGRLAEVLGPDLLQNDRFFRTIGVGETARKSVKRFHKLDPENPMKKAALAYMKGVNAFIDKGATPLEFQILDIPKTPFTIDDTYAIFGYMAFSFAQGFRTDPLVERIRQKYGLGHLRDLDVHWDPGAQKIPVWFRNQGDAAEVDIQSDSRETLAAATDKPYFGINDLFVNLPVAPWIGSNSWVMGPSKTKSGKPILSNDTHMGFSQPSVWYEAHIECPGVSLYGCHLAGVPFSIMGHNRYMAVGITMFENDDMDFYVEKLNPENSDQVWFKDRWEDVSTRKELIKVKGAEDVEFVVKTTRHGPIVNEAIDEVAHTTDQPVSLWWVFNEFDSKSLELAYQMGRASSIDEVRDAVALGHAPGLNITYADTDGNIAWWTMAKLPMRPSHVNSKLFLDGASGEDEIIRYLDFSENPQSENPPQGYVYSANNQPDSTAGILHPGYYIPEDRAKRIVEILDGPQKWDMESAKEMILDVQSPIMPEMAREIVSLVSNPPPEGELQFKAIQALQSWDGKSRLEDIAPTIFTKTLYHIAANTFQDEMGERDFKTWLKTHMIKRTLPLLVKNDSAIWWDDVSTQDKKESRKDIVRAAFITSLSELETQLGPDMASWKWGRVHTLEHPHALGKVEALRMSFNVGPFPVPGNTEVINNLQFGLNGDGEYKVTGGPAKRRVIDFSDLEHSVNVLPTGQSGNVMSDHYDDQAQMYVDGEFRLQMMNEEEIRAKENRKLVLRP